MDENAASRSSPSRLGLKIEKRDGAVCRNQPQTGGSRDQCNATVSTAYDRIAAT